VTTTHDRNGAAVEVGAKVRVLNIGQALLARLAPEDAADVSTMNGAVLEVYEVDQSGAAWVKKWWHCDDGSAYSHSLSLAPDEMELAGPWSP